MSEEFSPFFNTLCIGFLNCPVVLSSVSHLAEGGPNIRPLSLIQLLTPGHLLKRTPGASLASFL